MLKKIIRRHSPAIFISSFLLILSLIVAFLTVIAALGSNPIIPLDAKVYKWTLIGCAAVAIPSFLVFHLATNRLLDRIGDATKEHRDTD